MICTECRGRGETIYYEEIDRDENTVTVAQRKGTCRTCNGSGEMPMTNADRIRAMSDEELAAFICDRCHECSLQTCPGAEMCNGTDGRANGLVKWLQQTAEEDPHGK